MLNQEPGWLKEKTNTQSKKWKRRNYNQYYREYSVMFIREYVQKICSNVHKRMLWIVICAFLVARLVKNPPAMPETWILSLGWEDPLEKGKATHSSILAWRIPWMVKFMGSQRVGHNWATFTFIFNKLNTLEEIYQFL